MSDFGTRLKEAREARGVTLRQIASATKISMRALEALERGDYARLPGGIFSRAFVRAYALQVGLDPEQTVNEFLTEHAQQEQASADTDAPEISADDRAFLERQRKAAFALRTAIIVIVLAIIGGIVWWQMRGPDATAATPASPPAVRLPPPPPASPPATTSASPPAFAPPASSVDAGLEVAIETTAECWAQVTVDGTVALARILSAGERQQFHAANDVQLQVGNAGAVKWTINGRPAKPLGKWGSTGRAKLTKANIADFVQ